MAGAVPKPVRLVVDTTVRHGPLAGGQLAAAWAESHFALEGLDDNSRQALAKATAPILTTVHRFTGSHDMRLLLPAGEIGDGEVTLRWQEMALDTSVSGNRVQGTWRWPELALLGLPSRDDEDAQEAELRRDSLQPLSKHQQHAASSQLPCFLSAQASMLCTTCSIFMNREPLTNTLPTLGKTAHTAC